MTLRVEPLATVKVAIATFVETVYSHEVPTGR